MTLCDRIYVVHQQYQVSNIAASGGGTSASDGIGSTPPPWHPSDDQSHHPHRRTPKANKGRTPPADQQSTASRPPVTVKATPRWKPVALGLVDK
ncbi:MAG: hypothetical protein M1819_000043 [Sarea resinae]|nr:MAG: hypothetical protein M1819_000043 [Sarea resinae]